MTIPVKYFASNVTETMYHCFFLLEITMVKIMNNLIVCSAHSYLNPRSRFNATCLVENNVFYSLCFDPTGARTHDLLHSRRVR